MFVDEIQLLRNQISSCQQVFYYTGGRGGIRTHAPIKQPKRGGLTRLKYFLKPNTLAY
jgi:hypothetical protein